MTFTVIPPAPPGGGRLGNRLATAWQPVSTGPMATGQPLYIEAVAPSHVDVFGGEQPDNDLRELQFKKNQYGPTNETIVRYEHGLFLPVTGMTTIERAAREAKAEEVFLELLRSFDAQNRRVSDKKSPTYAPAVFAEEELAKKAHFDSRALADAMRRLFAANKIWNEPCGRRDRGQFRIALKP